MTTYMETFTRAFDAELARKCDTKAACAKAWEATRDHYSRDFPSATPIKAATVASEIERAFRRLYRHLFPQQQHWSERRPYACLAGQIDN